MVPPGCFRIPSSERLSDKCKLGGGVPTTSARVVLLEEEESHLQVTSYRRLSEPISK